MKKGIALAVTVVMLWLFAPSTASALPVYEYSGINQVTVLADDDDDDGWFGIKGLLDGIKSAVQSIKDALSPQGNQAKDVLIPLCESLSGIMLAGWQLIKVNIQTDSIFQSQGLFGTGNLVWTIATSLTAFAVGIYAIFFMLEQSKKLKREEGLELKTYVKTIGELAPGIFWIASSYVVCYSIVQINQAMVTAVFSVFDDNGGLFSPLGSIDSWFDAGCEIPLIGFFIDLLQGINALMPMLLASIVMLLVSWIVTIKLYIRQIDICCLMCVSPIFFGLNTFDVGQKYFSKFLMTFISAVTQTLFMAIVFAIGLTWQAGQMIDMAASKTTFGDYLAQFIIPIAIGIMLIKPPRVLQALVSA